MRACNCCGENSGRIRGFVKIDGSAYCLGGNVPWSAVRLTSGIEGVSLSDDSSIGLRSECMFMLRSLRRLADCICGIRVLAEVDRISKRFPVILLSSYLCLMEWCRKNQAKHSIPSFKLARCAAQPSCLHQDAQRALYVWAMPTATTVITSSKFWRSVAAHMYLLCFW